MLPEGLGARPLSSDNTVPATERGPFSAGPSVTQLCVCGGFLLGAWPATLMRHLTFAREHGDQTRRHVPGRAKAVAVVLGHVDTRFALEG